MNGGLQVWDGSGNILLDTNERSVRILGQFNTIPNQSGSISIDISQGTPWFQVFCYILKAYSRPNFTLSGSTLSWTAAPYSANVKYGTF